MQRKISTLSILSFLLVALVCSSAALEKPNDGGPALSAPPKTATNDVKDVVQGTEIVDPYRWLEDQNSPETRAWIGAQNAYTDAALSKIPGREEIKRRVTALLKIDAMGTPAVESDRYFFTKRQADQDQSVLYMRKGLQGKDEVLIDPLPMSAEHTITVNLFDVTHDGKLIAYALRQGGADETALHLFDVDAHKDLPDIFPKARYAGFAILPDKSGVYLTKVMPEGPRVFFHKIGTETAQDVEVFGKGYGPEMAIGNFTSENDRYLIITVYQGSAAEKTEIYFQDLVKKGPIVPIVNNVHAAFFGQIAGDHMYVRTNWKAPKWRIMEVDLKDPAPEHWRELIPESDAVMDGLSLVGGKLAVHMTQTVVPRLKLFDVNGKLLREVPLPTLGSISGLSGRWSSNEAFFSFTSYHMPPTIYRYDVASGKQSVWSQFKAPIETEKYEVKQVWYTSKDGTKVPMFLAHAKNIKLDGSNPTLLTGYGGFNVSSTPGYNSFAAAWMASGGVYAVANLRGGGEFGEEWHHAGMLAKKQNVFDDFIAAAEWLIQNKYTTSSRLAIRGTSNGGLLVGAALTQRPELFGAVICGYPLLDMVRYHNFLVAKYWVPEYGSSDDPEQFKYIYAYSPYHHVQPGTKYPSVLLISGDSDTRVAPLHARKMTARLQAATVGSDHPVLLHYEATAGHSGGTPVSKQVENTTDELDFLLWQLGMSNPAKTQTAQGK